MEGKLLFTQPNDNNWRKGRTIKLTPINALLVTNGKVSFADFYFLCGCQTLSTVCGLVKDPNVNIVCLKSLSLSPQDCFVTSFFVRGYFRASDISFPLIG